MPELTSLAQKFGLQEELCYGGCLEKILSLLGYNWERKFVSKCKNANAKKPEEWERLREFLNTELATREKLSILDKSKRCLGIEQHGGFGSGVKKGNKFANTTSETIDRMECHICESNDRVVTPNGNARRDVPYYACRKFVEMSTDDRRKLLFKRKLCAQCLEPKTMNALRSSHVLMVFTKNLKVGFMFWYVLITKIKRKIKA